MTITISGSGTIGGPTTFTDNVTLGTSLLATPSGSTPSYLCRAWVNFNGTGTVAIRASGNVTSITDNGTGNYTVNFTNAMPDVNYSWAGSVADATGSAPNISAGYSPALYSTTQLSIRTWSYAGTPFDSATLCVNVFR